MKEIKNCKPILCLVMNSIDNSRLSPEAFQDLMLASSQCNIKKIKEIIAELDRQKSLTPPPLIPPVQNVYPPVNSFQNNLDRLRGLPENHRTIPCKNFHGPQGCPRAEFCHFIHLNEFRGVEIPRDVFFKA